MSRPKMEPKNSSFLPPADTDAIPTTVGTLSLTGLLLSIDEGPRAGQQLMLREGVSILGRASTADVRIDHPSISRQHAQILRRGDRFFLKDLGSQNGTFLNRTRIDSEVELYRGDEIAIGNAVLRLVESTNTGTLAPPPASWSPPATSSLASSPPPSALLGAHGSTIQMNTKLRQGPGVGQTAVIAGLLGFIVAGVGALSWMKWGGSKDMEGSQLSKPNESAIELVIDEPIVKTSGTSSTDRKTADSQSEDRASILGLYEQGRISGALELARVSPHSDLLDALTRFQESYEGGKAASRTMDTARAIELFENALKVDGDISQGNSQFQVELKRELSELLVAQAKRQQSNSDIMGAKKSLKAALTYNRENGTAKTFLATLSGTAERAGASSKKGTTKNARTKFDDDADFADERPKKKGKKTRNAIDDAFDE